MEGSKCASHPEKAKVQLSQLIMSVKQYTAKNVILSSWINNIQQKINHPLLSSAKRKGLSLKPNSGRGSGVTKPGSATAPLACMPRQKFDFLAPLRNWFNNIEVSDRDVAHRLCKLIPNQCPFERQITLFGKTILNIPPLCKLNPFYNELVGLRFRAICYLADVCDEDVSSYC
ncbi:MAG: hypothetical protein Tsb0014_36970 [Pleurocapsa sp.]